MFDSLRNDEYNDLVKLGWLEPGVAGGTMKLSAKGLDAYARLVESLPAKDQVLLAFNTDNTEALVADIKNFMN